MLPNGETAVWAKFRASVLHCDGESVTNPIAFVMASAIIAAILADAVLNNSEVTIFLLLKFVDLIEYVSFWR